MKQVTILKHYLICALWSSHDIIKERGKDDIEYFLEEKFNVNDFSNGAILKAQKDIRNFTKKNRSLLMKSKLNDEQIGHDFWLTRNSHGSGFWDRNLGEVGQKLTESCKKFNPVDTEVGDDNKLHFL